MPPNDFGSLITTYGPIGGVIILFLWQLYKDIRARNKAQDEREKSQDARDTDLAKVFKQQLDIFQETSRANAEAAAQAAATSAAANDRAATVFDKVTARLDAMTTQLQIASEQRAEQLTVIKAITVQLANPQPRFTKVVEDIHGPIISKLDEAVKKVNKATEDTLDAGLKEIRDILKKIETEIGKIGMDTSTFHADITRVEAKVDQLTTAVAASQAPTQTVTLQLPTTTPTQAPTKESEPKDKKEESK